MARFPNWQSSIHSTTHAQQEFTWSSRSESVIVMWMLRKHSFLEIRERRCNIPLSLFTPTMFAICVCFPAFKLVFRVYFLRSINNIELWSSTNDHRVVFTYWLRSCLVFEWLTWDTNTGKQQTTNSAKDDFGGNFVCLFIQCTFDTIV